MSRGRKAQVGGGGKMLHIFIFIYNRKIEVGEATREKKKNSYGKILSLWGENAE